MPIPPRVITVHFCCYSFVHSWKLRDRESAEGLRALAAKHETTLAKLVVRMMEVFEDQTAK